MFALYRILRKRTCKTCAYGELAPYKRVECRNRKSPRYSHLKEYYSSCKHWRFWGDTSGVGLES